MTKKPQMIAKEEAVAKLRADMSSNSATFLLDYKGITVAQDTKFRKALREAGISYYVARNTLIKRAAHEEGLEFFDEYLEGTTAIAFSEDPVVLAKLVVENQKDIEAIKVKVAAIDGKYIPVDQVEALSKLPSREVLLAQVVGGMQAPLSGLASCMNGVISGFVRCLGQIAAQKEA